MKLRAKILAALFLAWAAALAASVFHYTVSSREIYLQQSRHLSEREGRIPAIRGRILDCEVRPLAWSTRHYDLKVKDAQHPMSAKRKKQLLGLLPQSSPPPTFDDLAAGRTLKKDLMPAEINTLGALLEQAPELVIAPRFERHVVDYPAVKEYLGKTESHNSVCVGISGVELERDAELQGQDGVFRVMIDKQGRWVPGTWQLIREMQPGKDICVDNALDELVGPTMRESIDESDDEE